MPFGPFGPAISSWPNFSATVILLISAVTSPLIACCRAALTATGLVRAARETVESAPASNTTAATNAASPSPEAILRLGFAQTAVAIRSAIPTPLR